MNGTDEHSVLGQRGTYRRILLMSLGLGVATLGFFVLRALVAGLTITGVLLHGEGVETAVGAVLFFLLMGLIGRSGLRLNNASGAPRDPTWRIMGLFIAAPIFRLSAIFINNYLRASELVVNGLPAGARLISTTDSGCSKTGCTTEIDYAFIPRGWKRPLKGSIEIVSSHGQHSTEEYDYMKSTGIVPLMYDRNDPSKATLFWKDNIQRNASLGRLFRLEAITTGLVLAVLSPLIFGIWRLKRKRAAATDVMHS